nr:replication associated protein [Bat associated circovirus]
MTLYSKVCFTLNNYTEEEEKKFFEWDQWKYIVIGREIGESGTPHLQGYGELLGRKRLTTLKKFDVKAHWENLKSTPEAASNYCKKDGNFQERGEISSSKNKKKELQEWIKIVKEANMRKLLEEPPNLSTCKLMEKYLTYLEPVRNEKPTVTWLWGASGTGKSRKAQELAGDDVYWKDGEKWWDGYDRHESIIIDDFRASNMKFNYLLRLLDRYPMRVEVKGGYRQLNSKNIFITTIVHPDKVYQLEDEPIKQLMRRIDKIIECNEKNLLSQDDEMNE